MSDKTPEKQDAFRSSSGLWDDIEPYLAGLMGEPDSDFLVSVQRTIRSQTSALPLVESSNPGADLEYRPEIFGEMMGTPPEESHMPEIAAAVLQDVEHIKDQYIVGKVVGRDLIHRSGRRLARQGERITKQLVRTAEAEGLLVDLIDYMTFDSFEE